MTLQIADFFQATRVGLVAAVLACATAVAVGAPGGRGEIDSFQYSDSAAAQAAWSPMAGSAPVEVAEIDGRKVLRLACTFADAKVERASWDRKLDLDLASCRGVQFDISCGEAAPVSYFSIYFQSGEGWYHGAFFPESSTGWNTIRLDKTAMVIEGKPAGWGRIQTIRISAWRGKESNTEFYLRDLQKTGFLGVDAMAAVIRADSAAERFPQEAGAIRRFAETMAAAFDTLGIGAVVMSDLDVSAERLKEARLVVLPNNPSMLDRGQEALISHIAGGGKLLAFYTLPERVRAALGIPAGQHRRAEYPGQFSTIRARAGLLPEAPDSVAQRSWNINAVRPLPGKLRVLADWLDDKGKPAGEAAILASTNCVLMTHVLLANEGGNKHQLLLAMAGLLAPDLWRSAAESTLARIGVIGGFRTAEEAINKIGEFNPQDAALTATLVEARGLRKAALARIKRGEFADAINEAAEAARCVEKAFCMAQRTAALLGAIGSRGATSPTWASEFRAFWCHSAFGVEGIEWDEAIRRLADNGFTAILPNMLWGGIAYYPSALLPVAPEVAQRSDQIAKCLEACRRHGIEMHVWKVNWNLGHAAPKAFVEKMRQARRLQSSVQGKEEPWLCPSHPENQKLEIDSMVEVARLYHVDGLHFDYIRYPDGDHCFCDGCRERFQSATGLDVAAWPQSVLRDGPLRQPWLEWRRANITAVVKGVSAQARAVRPGIKISAAVFPNWTADRDGIGQDWKLWCEKGYVDFVCPMDYTDSNTRFSNMVADQVRWAGRVPCYPGIGLSASSPRLGVDRVIEQITIARQHKTGGFVIFNYAVPESAEVLPLLGLGITKKQ